MSTPKSQMINGLPLIRQSNQTWLTDGNLVIVAPSDVPNEYVSFRVYKGILARESEVFRDMLAIPQPGAESPEGEEKIDGCPVVRLSDDAKDWEHVLPVVFDGGHKYFHDSSLLPFATISAMLRLGDKYLFSNVRDEAIRRLKATFPPDFSDHTPFSEMCQKPSGLISFQEDEIMAVVHLARAIPLPSILPTAVYATARLPTKQLFRAVRANLCTLDDLEYCLLATDALKTLSRALWTAHQHHLSQYHCGDEQCKMYINDLRTRQLGLIEYTMLAKHSLDDIRSKHPGLCGRCVTYYHREREVDREQFVEHWALFCSDPKQFMIPVQ